MQTVQTQLALRFTKSLQEKTKADLDIAKIKIDLLGHVNFNGVVGMDHRGDTLFFIDHFQSRLTEANQTLNGKVVFGAAQMEGFDLRLKQYEGDSLTNLELFIQKLSQNKNDPNISAGFNMDELVFSKGKISINLPHFKWGEIHLNDIKFELKAVDIRYQKVSGQLKNLSFNSPEWGTVKSLDASVLKTANQWQVDSLSLVTLASRIKGNTHIVLTPEKGTVDQLKVSLSAEALDPREWGFEKYYPYPLQAEVRGSGNLSQLKLDALRIFSQHLALDSKANLQLDTIRENTKLTLTIDSLRAQSSVFKSLAQQQILPQEFININDNLELFYLGDLSFSKDQVEVLGQLRQNNGVVDLAANWPLYTNKDKPFSLQLQAKNWDLQNLIGKAPIQFLSGKMDLKGILSNKKFEKLDWQMAIDELGVDHQRLFGLSSQGAFSQGIWSGQLDVRDRRLDLTTQFLLHTEDPLQVNIINFDAQNLNLGLFRSFSELGNSTLKGTIDARFTNLDPNKINGNFKFSNWSLSDQKEGVRFDDFTLQAHTKNKYRTLAIQKSDFIEGEIRGIYQLTDLGRLMKNTLSRAYPFAFAHTFDQSQNALIDITIAQKALNAAFPEWNIEKDFTINGLLHAEPEKGRLQISAPLLKYKKSLIQGLELTLNPAAESNENTFYADRWVYNNYVFDHLELSSQEIKEGLLLQISAQGGNQRKDSFSINTLHTIVPQKELRFELLPSTVRFKSYEWQLFQEESNPTRFAYQLDDQTIEIKDFSAQSKHQSIKGAGYFSNANNFEIQAVLDAVALQAVLPEIKNFDIQGLVSSEVEFTRSPEKNNLNLDLTIDGLSINKEKMGQLKMLGSGNTQLGTYNTKLELENQQSVTLLAEGTLQNGSQGPNLNLDITFDDFQLNFLNPLAKGSLDNIRGFITGKTYLWGPLSDLSHDGQLQLSKASLNIPYLNVNYLFDDAKVILTQQTFAFSKVPFVDPKFETQGLLSGKFSHQNFNNWSLDFELSSDRILVFDIMESSDRVFYGQGFFGGQGSLTGPAKSLLLTLNGKTEAGTNFKIPWTEDYGLVDTSFIDFVGKRNQKETKTKEKKVVKTKKPFEMDFELDVTKAATIEIVIDPETNSSLSGKGVGTLLMEINTEDKFNMWGDFLTTEGTYNFKNLGVIDKKFSLKPGGSVNWEGDPLGAQMNMEAVYSVPGGANPALLLDNPNFNRKIPTEVSIQLQGNLLQPDDPKFSIQFPNTNNLVVSEINYRLADPQRSQLQAISLLSQGVFISDVSVSVQGITNNLYEKASDVLSSLLGEQDEKLKVGVNYLQGERNNELAVDTEDRLGLTLSTQISDKILINGKIGVPVGGIVQTQVVGDVQIDFILNEDGSLRAKVFNKENEFRYIGQDFGYTQGMGLSYNVDFNNFRDLIQKIKKQATKDSLQKINYSK